ncbi:MAG: T9SS type A sorting domain-containing protein [Cyclobacteriaceae bacterium]
MKYFYSFLFTTLFFSYLSGQNLLDKWSDEVNHMTHYRDFVDAGADDQGNVYLLGYESGDIILVKYSSSGLVWERTFDGGYIDEPEALVVDGDGNAYVVGSTDADGAGKIEALVIKYNSSGTVLWSDAYNFSGGGSTIYDGVYNDVVWDGSHLYAVGTQVTGAAKAQDIFISRYTTTGTRTSKIYDNGNSKEYGNSITLSDDHVHVVAIVGPDESGYGDLRYLKLDKTFTSLTTPDRDQFVDVNLKSVTGFSASENGDYAAVVKDEGSTTSFYVFSGGNTGSYTEGDISNVKDVYIHGTDIYLTGSDTFDSQEKLVFAKYSSTGVRSYLKVYETSTGNTDHGYYSSVGAKIYMKNSGSEIGVLGNLVEAYNDGSNHYERLGEVVFQASTGEQLQSYYGGIVNVNNAKYGFVAPENVIIVATGPVSVDMNVLCVVPDFDLGSDISQEYDAEGNSFELDAGAGFSGYLWSTGETTQTINVTTAGEFSATVTNSNGCSATDEIETIITPISQTITWEQTLDPTYRDENIMLVATSSSGLDVTFESSDDDIAEAVYMTDHWELEIKTAGVFTLTASQAGNENYEEIALGRSVTIDYLDYYWVNGTGIYGKSTTSNLITSQGHWVTISGGSTRHDLHPDQYCNVFFDANSFDGADQAVRSPANSVLKCHDFDASGVTNYPSFELEKLEVYGSFTFGDATALFNYLYFTSDETVQVDFAGVEIYDQFESLRLYFHGLGTYQMTGDLVNKDATLSLGFGTLEILSGSTLTTTQPIDLGAGASLINNGALIFESGATFYDAAGSSFSGNDFTFKRNTPHDESTGKYSIVGSPVAGASTAALGSLVYSYDESQDYLTGDGINRFVEVTTPEAMSTGSAYFSAYTGEIVIEGLPTTGTVDVPLSYTASAGSEADYDGFNLVSNPYSSRIQVLPFNDYDGFLEENGPNGTGAIAGSIYLWRDEGSNGGRRSNADYMVVNSLGEVSGNSATGIEAYQGYINTFQGFFVQATGPGKTVTFTNAMRRPGLTSPDSRFYRQAAEDIFKIRVGLESETDFSEMLIGFPEDADLGKDLLYDALRLSNNDLEISSLINGKRYAIQGLPLIETADIIPLYVQTSTAALHQLEITLEALPAGVEIILIDNYLDKTIAVTENFEYAFYSKAGQFADRFALTTAANVLALDDQKVSIYAANKTLFITGEQSQPTAYRLFDLSGHQVHLVEVTGSAAIDFSNLASGVYVVSDGVESKRVIFK